MRDNSHVQSTAKEVVCNGRRYNLEQEKWQVHWSLQQLVILQTQQMSGFALGMEFIPACHWDASRYKNSNEQYAAIAALLPVSSQTQSSVTLWFPTLHHPWLIPHVRIGLLGNIANTCPPMQGTLLQQCLHWWVCYMAANLTNILRCVRNWGQSQSWGDCKLVIALAEVSIRCFKDNP